MCVAKLGRARRDDDVEHDLPISSHRMQMWLGSVVDGSVLS